MKTVKIEGSIVKVYGEITFASMPKETMDENPDWGYLYIQPHTIEVEIDPAFDERKAKIKALEAAAKKVRDDYNAKIEKINTEISKLQAIGYEDGQHSESAKDILDDGVPF